MLPTVAEPPKLSRLKCAGHHHKGNISSNALQTEQFWVCRVTSRYNHRFSDRTSIPRTKASPEILQPQFLQHRHSNDYKPVKNYYYKANLSKTVIQITRVSSEFKTAEEENDDYNTSQRYTKLAQERYHSSRSLPAEDVSHSTDQPGGKEQGQGKLATWSSKLIPEKGFQQQG